MRNKYSWVVITSSTILILDQVTKYIVERQIRLYEIITVIPGFFNLTHVRNRGAAFSLFSTASDSFRSFFFLTVTIVAIIVIALLIKKTHERILIVAFSFIMGGALGNAIDRVRYGEVVDFIQWYYRSYYWPSFNIADSAITIAVVLLAIDMLFRKSEKTAKT
jgi:signal peptidase II